MKIALFGATGATGKYLIEEALGLGHQVFVYGRNASRVSLKNPNVMLVDGQIHDRTAVAKVLQGVDAVICALGPGYKSPPGTVIARGIDPQSGAPEHQSLKRTQFDCELTDCGPRRRHD
jgi:putative NADH-flavin reductase